jgi:hypothetical protein
MSNLVSTAKKALVGVVAVGALSMGSAGIAGAATTTTAPTSVAHFNCARAGKVLARIEKGEAHIAAGLPRLTAAEAKAKANGNTARAARIEKRIARLESSTFKARLTRVSAAIEAKCHVSAPTTSTSGA